jgi:hypothetical membrane protein
VSRRQVGALFWILAIQFFIVQVVVQAAWTTPFSLATNFISDLGNTVCANYPIDSQSYVCSPRHGLMNLSFITLGITRVGGTILLWSAFPRSWLSRASLGLIALSGIGAILVGLYPENVDIGWHRIGAGLDLIFGNLGIALLGVALVLGRRAGIGGYSIVSGVVGLIALWLFLSDRYFGLGIGGMERLAAYPISVWMIVFGICLVVQGRAPRAPANT